MGLRMVTFYTDGACVHNPGPGGYGVVLLQDGPGRQGRELIGGYRLTTNQRMKILMVIKGLEALKQRCRVQVYNDSKYVADGISLGWTKRWTAKNWIMKKPWKRRPNAELWKKLLNLCKQHEVTISWVKGHSGDKENERCDYLAETAARMTGLPPDPGYPSRETTRVRRRPCLPAPGKSVQSSHRQSERGPTVPTYPWPQRSKITISVSKNAITGIL